MADAYDPDAPEGSKNLGNQYIGRKDIIVIGVVVVGLAIAAIPLYKQMKERSDQTVCKKNLRNIGSALSLYAEAHDQRFPPMYNVGDNGSPALANGLPIVWASVSQQYMPRGGSFTCPSAHHDEATTVNGISITSSMFSPETSEVQNMALTYGMYLKMSTRPISDISSQSTTALVSETSNMGARGAFNPLPFTNSEGEVVPYDGFMIGYDNSNRDFDASTKAVTRLSFYNVPNGDFRNGTDTARHGTFIHVLYADMHVGPITPEMAQVDTLQGSQISGLWSDN